MKTPTKTIVLSSCLKKSSVRPMICVVCAFRHWQRVCWNIPPTSYQRYWKMLRFREKQMEELHTDSILKNCSDIKRKRDWHIISPMYYALHHQKAPALHSGLIGLKISRGNNLINCISAEDFFVLVFLLYSCIFFKLSCNQWEFDTSIDFCVSSDCCSLYVCVCVCVRPQAAHDCRCLRMWLSDSYLMTAWVTGGKGRVRGETKRWAE